MRILKIWFLEVKNIIFRFTASHVRYSFEDGVNILGFADNLEELQAYLLLQRGAEFDGQDKELDQDTYYIEVGENGVAGYGGISSISVQSNRLVVKLEQTAAWRKNLSSIQIDYQLIHYDLNSLKQSLQKIFIGTPAQLIF